MSIFTERLRKEIDRIGVSELARASGFARNTLYNWCDKGNIPLDKLLLLADFGLDVDYVVSGKSYVQNIEQDGEYSSVPVYDVEVSAGDGAINEEQKASYSLAFRKDWLKSRGLHVKDLHVVIARGDSMEPTIGDKDSLLVCTAEKIPKDGHIYVIRNGNMLWVKRIQLQLDGGLLLISDNKVYPPMLLNLDGSSDVEIIGKVVNSSKNFY